MEEVEYRDCHLDSRYKIGSDGTVIGAYGRPLVPWVIHSTSPKYGIQAVGIAGHSKSVHVLVAHAFLGPKPAGKEVDHINGDSMDNRAVNLRYLTHIENTQHRAAQIMHCRKGHEYPTAAIPGTHRKCDTCRRDRNRAAYYEGKARMAVSR